MTLIHVCFFHALTMVGAEQVKANKFALLCACDALEQSIHNTVAYTSFTALNNQRRGLYVQDEVSHQMAVQEIEEENENSSFRQYGGKVIQR